MKEDIRIIKELENNIFKRKELFFEMSFPKAPSKEEILDLISEKLSSSKEAIVIDSIKGKFGTFLFTVSAKVYASEQDKEKTEPKSKKDKNLEVPKVE
jgi:ribosomal protein S24E